MREGRREGEREEMKTEYSRTNYKAMRGSKRIDGEGNEGREGGRKGERYHSIPQATSPERQYSP